MIYQKVDTGIDNFDISAGGIDSILFGLISYQELIFDCTAELIPESAIYLSL